MSFAPETDIHTETLARPEALLRVPVGLASPLWGLFASAAVGGAAWWWMTRWTRIENLEAMFGAAAEATPEPLAETVEVLAEAPASPEPVGGEAAPISPVVEALTPEAVAEDAPKPRKAPAPKSA